ncbi:hypothetical protein G6F32_015351 [Rhizopus arrhizus]|nr:hypothetical protein G6F32_015351 [Rhizopus arrhizus]
MFLPLDRPVVGADRQVRHHVPDEADRPRITGFRAQQRRAAPVHIERVPDVGVAHAAVVDQVSTALDAAQAVIGLHFGTARLAQQVVHVRRVETGGIRASHQQRFDRAPFQPDVPGGFLLAADIQGRAAAVAITLPSSGILNSTPAE